MIGRSRRGTLFVLSAPSGTGKSTLAKRLLDEDDRMSFSVSYTTRDRRKGERDGREYHFVDDATFDRMVEGAQLLEWASVFGKRYGTGRAATEECLSPGIGPAPRHRRPGRAADPRERRPGGVRLRHAARFLVPRETAALPTDRAGRGGRAAARKGASRGGGILGLRLSGHERRSGAGDRRSPRRRARRAPPGRAAPGRGAEHRRGVPQGLRTFRIKRRRIGCTSFPRTSRASTGS